MYHLFSWLYFSFSFFRKPIPNQNRDNYTLIRLLFQMEIRLAKAFLPLVTTYIKSKWLTKCIHINVAMMENAFFAFG